MRSSISRAVTNVRRFTSKIALGTTFVFLSVTAFLLGMSPGQSLACACGCGIFDVGTSAMFPDGPGGMVFLQYSYQNQSQNWSGPFAAPAANNPDVNLHTGFITAGIQYMFNRSWGVQAEVPFASRSFTTDTNFGSSPPNQVTTNWGDLGDIRIRGIYTGFSDDLSTGITFGVKLPTGNYTFNPDIVDRDTQIGTGSTDLLLGFFHRGGLASDNSWSWFAQALLDLPVFARNDYLPGTEVDAALGVTYKGWAFGNGTISPLAQLIGTVRSSDSGSASANPVASGYQRLLFAPGVEINIDRIMIYADVEIPVYTNVIGNQLVAPLLFKLITAYKF